MFTCKECNSSNTNEEYTGQSTYWHDYYKVTCIDCGAKYGDRVNNSVFT